jgi:pyruvate,water dikinase
VRTKDEPLLSGGRTLYPGRVSGRALLLEDAQRIGEVPEGAVVFARRPSPEIVEIFPRIAGLVAESGNITGHAATLLREFRVPPVFLMPGAFGRLKTSDPVSLDAVGAKVYAGALWPQRKAAHRLIGARAGDRHDPISRRLLALNLLDPEGANFRPAGCKSAHDVLRYCHEKAIEAMFEVGDIVLEKGSARTRRLKTGLPLNILVLDLGGGLSMASPESREVTPAEIVSRPFQSLWKGVTRPGVSWTREMPASFSDLASVLASALTPHGNPMRALGEKSYLLVAGTYMNLNSRLAYHFSLVDACVCDTPGENYISFRFEGGGATRERRSLRACFIERGLAHYGYHVDRRGELVNAWFRKAPAAEMEEKLDILGRLLGCTSQLDMFMTSHEVMRWYLKQFLDENYSFQETRDSILNHRFPGPGNR